MEMDKRGKKEIMVKLMKAQKLFAQKFLWDYLGTYQSFCDEDCMKIVDTTKSTKSTIREEILKVMNRYHGYTYANQKKGLRPYRK